MINLAADSKSIPISLKAVPLQIVHALLTGGVLNAKLMFDWKSKLTFNDKLTTIREIQPESVQTDPD